jgi:uncharacterized protein YegL
MKANSVTYICFVQDHSGSMSTNAKLATDNFNEQRAKLLKEDDDTMDNIVTIIEFDDDIHCNIENMPINEVKKLDKWWTGGMTSLYDAIAFGIDKTKKKMDADEREDKAALIVVQTDGHENNSSDYKGEDGRKRINTLINELEETKIWTFTFLGENIDKEVAMDLGFKASNVMSHKSGGNEVRYAYACSTQGLGDFLSARKRGATQTMNFYDNKTSDKEPPEVWNVNQSGGVDNDNN